MQQPRVGLSESANPGLSDSIPSGLQHVYGHRFGEQAISIPLKTSRNHFCHMRISTWRVIWRVVVVTAGAMLASISAGHAQAGGQTPLYLDPKRPVEERINDLMSRMTLKEKVGHGSPTDGEGHDVASLDLSGVQEDLVQAVFETGTPTVVVLINGRPLSTRWTCAGRSCRAILRSWWGNRRQKYLSKEY